MNKRAFTCLCAALLLAVALPYASLAQPIKYGQAGMKFLQIDVGGRMAAMGSTHAGIAGDAVAMFANPAGLALVQGLDMQAAVTNWIADIRHYGAGAAYRMGNLGTVGVSVVSMDYGDFIRTEVYTGSDPVLSETGYVEGAPFTVTEYAVGLSYARQITGQFYIGGQARYARQDLGEVEIVDELTGSTRMQANELGTVVLDFGTMYYPGFHDLRFGASVRNFANQSDYYDQRFELPLTFDFGIAMDVMNVLASPGGNSSLVLAADWLHPRDYAERLHVGAEYGFMNMLFLRGGYKFNYDSEGLTAGVGVNVGTGGIGLKADYAYGTAGEFFGEIHRISLGIRMQ